MAPEWIRHLSVLLIPLLLVAGFATNVSRATYAGAEPMVAVAHWVPPGGGCGSDGDREAVSPISCSVLYCNSATTIQGTSVSIEILPAGRRAPISASAMTGHADPPDPYPPRSRILS